MNEKVALENALAAAWCGIRALCTMKHVGLNVAADPLMTSAYTGVTGGLVIMSADDPFAHSSQNEQDTRCYAHFARVPCLDPASVQEAHAMIRLRSNFPRSSGSRCFFRPTTRICHSKVDVAPDPNFRRAERGVPRPPAIRRDPCPYPYPAQKTQRKTTGDPEAACRSGVQRFEIHGKTAIIAGGIGTSCVRNLSRTVSPS